MKNYKLIIPLERQYLDNLANSPVGLGTAVGSSRDRFMHVFEYFFQKGIRDFIVIGSDFWSYIPKIKAKYTVRIIAGGKIDSIRIGDKVLNMGADQIILATHFYQNIDSIKSFVKHFGKKLICSVDDKSGYLEGTKLSTRNFIKTAKKSGIKNFMYVNSNSKLRLKGVNTSHLSNLTKLFKKGLIYSGGVSTQKDLETLTTFGIKKIVVGTALYKGLLKIEDVRINFKKGQGLIPAIIQDSRNKEILMLGYMNQEAFSRTCETGFVHFWSRERKKLWMKGEESRNKLKIKRIFLDCDRDTLLIKAKLLGKGVCHTGKYSCFSENVIVD